MSPDSPRPPYLLIDGRRLDPGNLFVPVKENTELAVECISEGGRPSPILTWQLVPGPGAPQGDALPGLLLTNNTGQPGPGARSEARISRILRAHHNATVLCLVSHATLPAPLNASLLLDVQCKNLLILYKKNIYSLCSSLIIYKDYFFCLNYINTSIRFIYMNICYFLQYIFKRNMQRILKAIYIYYLYSTFLTEMFNKLPFALPYKYVYNILCV